MSIVRGEREIVYPGDRNPVLTDVSGESRTQQQFKEDSDINVIMARWLRTGVPPEQLVQNVRHGDFSNIPDLHTALNLIRQAEADFSRVPSKIRQRFENDPGKMLDFLDDPANEAEARELGLLPSLPEPPEAAATAEAAQPEPESVVTSP